MATAKKSKTKSRVERSSKAKNETTAGELSAKSLKKKESALAREYREQMQQMHAALVTEKRGWDSYYEAVDRVVTKKLYVADGYAHAREWLSEHVSDPERTALRYARVARLSSPDEIAQYTPTKIDLALSIRDAREQAAAKKKGVTLPRQPSTKPIDLAAQRYDVTRDGKRATLNLEQVKTPELRAILGSLTPSSRKRPADESAVTIALRAALAEQPGWEDVTIRETDSSVTVSGFRPDQAQELAKLLIEASKAPPAKPPAPAKKPTKKR